MPSNAGVGLPAFESAWIKAQVKHRQAKVGGPEMREFLGALRPGENGLCVSTGGFTTEPDREAQASARPMTLLDRDGFVRLLLEHYEQLDPGYKAQVPLRKVWLPTG